jgi:Ni/Co efflux regulator RcnB
MMRLALALASAAGVLALPPAARAQVEQAPVPGSHTVTIRSGSVDGRPLPPREPGALRRGDSLPPHWMSREHFIDEPDRLGLYAPPPGHGWSRFHRDAVLTDRYGRVIDVVYGIDDRWHEGGRDPAPRHRNDDQAAGAIIGGVAGAIAGNVIAGRGSRLAGSLLGAGAGAAVGAAIGGASERRGERFEGERRRRYAGPLPYDPGGYRGRFDGDVTYDGRWAGTWTGSFDGGPERVFTGSFDGAYRGNVPRHAHGGWDGTHWFGPVDHIAYHGGYGDTITTITIMPQAEPVTTTTETEYTEEPLSPRPARATIKPRSKTHRVIR